MKLLSLAYLVGTILLSSSCNSLVNEEVKSAVSAKKSISLEQWRAATGGAGQRLLENTALNTAILLSGWKSVQASAESNGLDEVTIDYQLKSSSNCSIGSAVPITSDGYFLTARHCIENKPHPHEIIVISGSGANFRAVTASYRVVWEARDKALDLALIHAPVRPAKVFPLDRWGTMNAGDLVAATGWSGNQEISQGAGKIIHLQNIPTSLEKGDWNEIYHDVPLAHGDSGGILFSPQGHLLGINSKFVINPLPFLLPGKRTSTEGYRGVSVVPDGRFIDQLIRADRQATAVR